MIADDRRPYCDLRSAIIWKPALTAEDLQKHLTAELFEVLCQKWESPVLCSKEQKLFLWCDLLSIFHSAFQQNLEIHKKMAMSDEQLEAYERQEREVCEFVCCFINSGFSVLHAIWRCQLPSLTAFRWLPFHIATFETGKIVGSGHKFWQLILQFLFVVYNYYTSMTGKAVLQRFTTREIK